MFVIFIGDDETIDIDAQMSSPTCDRWYNDWFANPYRIMKSYIHTAARSMQENDINDLACKRIYRRQTVACANGYVNFYVSISNIYDRSTYDLRLLLSPTRYILDISRPRMLKLLRNAARINKQNLLLSSSPLYANDNANDNSSLIFSSLNHYIYTLYNNK